MEGRILDPSGAPLNHALIKLWQADNDGTYIHSRGAQNAVRDPDFQGYGQLMTGSDGAYRFRTVKPGLNTGRTRHYHFGIRLPGRPRFTTQLYFKGEPHNESDMVLRDIRDAQQRDAVIRDFTPLPDSPELATTWDIVLGLTPADAGHGGDDHHGPPPR